MQDLLKMLKEKIILGEFGAFTRPYVVLDVDEYMSLMEALEKKPQRGRPRKVPQNASRA